MKGWIVALSALVLFAGAAAALLLRSATPSVSRVEHHGKTLIVYGHGPDAELGYLAAGRYELTIDQNENGCADSLSLMGKDGVEWFRIDPHLANYKDFARTRQIPGQRYVMHVDALEHGGLGPRTTPSPISNCAWTVELAPA